MEENKLKKFNTIYPWYAGLSGDLLFWIAIDTLLKIYSITDCITNININDN